jgi:hypothetical protein
LTNEKCFAQTNDCYKIIVAHPSTPQKNSKDIDTLPDPNYYSLAGGAMWANKCDNIIFCHRPKILTDCNNPMVKIIFSKIKKQPIVGKNGFLYVNHNWRTKRYEDDFGKDYFHITEKINKTPIHFDLTPNTNFNEPKQRSIEEIINSEPSNEDNPF